jgi:hypothetical protein
MGCDGIPCRHTEMVHGYRMPDRSAHYPGREVEARGGWAIAGGTPSGAARSSAKEARCGPCPSPPRGPAARPVAGEGDRGRAAGDPKVHARGAGAATVRSAALRACAPAPRSRGPRRLTRGGGCVGRRGRCPGGARPRPLFGRLVPAAGSLPSRASIAPPPGTPDVQQAEGSTSGRGLPPRLWCRCGGRGRWTAAGFPRRQDMEGVGWSGQRGGIDGMFRLGRR